MIKIHNLVAIALSMAFFISCGQEEQAKDKPNVRLNQSITIADILEIKEEEVSLIKTACALLNYKELNLRSSVGKTFNYLTQSRKCAATNVAKFTTSANVVYLGLIPTMQNNNPNTFMFSDVILRNHSVMKEFCDIAETKGMSTRYITSSSQLQYIYAESSNNFVNIGIQTGFDFDNDGKFKMELTDEFQIINNGSKSNGFLYKRVSENAMNCSGDGSESHYAELKL
jgi:hypothetical protein